jgi:hypothetical protein
MPVLRERDIERHLVRRVKALGGEVRKVKWIGRNGAPDRLVMLPERIDPTGTWSRRGFWVELKNPDTVQTFPADARERAQAREHGRMKGRGEPVYVVGTIEQVEALLA